MKTNNNISFMLFFLVAILAMAPPASAKKSRSGHDHDHGHGHEFEDWEAGDMLLLQRIESMQNGTPSVGPTGPAGPTGLTGPRGLAGSNGADGVAGPAGATGSVGPKGPTGLAGRNGADGVAGTAGAAGPVGPRGPTGPAGRNGVDGVAGPTGATGPAGSMGLPGIDGLDGRDAPDRSADICVLYQLLIDQYGMTDQNGNLLEAPVFCSPSVSEIGQRGPAGGFIFWLSDDGTRGLEAAPADAGTAIWCEDPSITGASGIEKGMGEENTDKILLDSICASPGSAARTADDYAWNDYTDWFLPSIGELDEMYRSIGPGALEPGDDVGGFSDDQYWSSSEIDADKARSRLFGVTDFGSSESGKKGSCGSFGGDCTTNMYSVRPVRFFIPE